MICSQRPRVDGHGPRQAYSKHHSLCCVGRHNVAHPSHTSQGLFCGLYRYSSHLQEGGMAEINVVSHGSVVRVQLRHTVL